MFQTVFFFQPCPGIVPVGPVIRHSYGIYFPFFLGLCNDLIQGQAVQIYLLCPSVSRTAAA